jgi:hypothetical protein
VSVQVSQLFYGIRFIRFCIKKSMKALLFLLLVLTSFTIQAQIDDPVSATDPTPAGATRTQRSNTRTGIRKTEIPGTIRRTTEGTRTEGTENNDVEANESDFTYSRYSNQVDTTRIIYFDKDGRPIKEMNKVYSENGSTIVPPPTPRSSAADTLESLPNDSSRSR